MSINVFVQTKMLVLGLVVRAPLPIAAATLC